MTINQAKNREFEGVIILWPFAVGGDLESQTAALQRADPRSEVGDCDRAGRPQEELTPRRPSLFEDAKALFVTLQPTLRYEPGTIVAEKEFVIVHGRFSGFGQPVNSIKSSGRNRHGLCDPSPYLPGSLPRLPNFFSVDPAVSPGFAPLFVRGARGGA